MSRGPSAGVDPVEAVAVELLADRAIDPQQLLTRLLDHLVVRARLARYKAQLAALSDRLNKRLLLSTLPPVQAGITTAR